MVVGRLRAAIISTSNTLLWLVGGREYRGRNLSRVRRSPETLFSLSLCRAQARNRAPFPNRRASSAAPNSGGPSSHPNWRPCGPRFSETQPLLPRPYAFSGKLGHAHKSHRSKRVRRARRMPAVQRFWQVHRGGARSWLESLVVVRHSRLSRLEELSKSPPRASPLRPLRHTSPLPTQGAQADAQSDNCPTTRQHAHRLPRTRRRRTGIPDGALCRRRADGTYATHDVCRTD